MQLSRLELRGFRCLGDQAVDLEIGINCVVGDNAAGKTSLLEAVFLLGRGRSFRARSAVECLRHGEAGWRLGGRITREEAPTDHQVLRFDGKAMRPECNGKSERFVEFARRLPVQLIEPGLHRVVEDGPGYRRRFLDWGMFHVEPRYLQAWQRYSRALRQRNALLRTRSGPGEELRSWTHELARCGSSLQAMRERGVHALQQRFAARGAALGLPELEVSLRRGWDDELDLDAALAARCDTDRRQGVTGVGPHRAELRFRMAGELVRQTISRGQQKLMLVALSLAQAELVQEALGIWPVVLLDDFTAELGGDYQQALAGALRDYRGQTVVCALQTPPVLKDERSTTMFHVEQGRIRRA